MDTKKIKFFTLLILFFSKSFCLLQAFSITGYECPMGAPFPNIKFFQQFFDAIPDKNSIKFISFDYYEKLTEKNLLRLKELTSLERLSLENLTNISETALNEVLSSLPNLKELKLGNTYKIKNLPFLPNVRELTLKVCYSFDKNVLEKFKNITNLEIVSCPWLDNDTIQYVSQFESLSSLSLEDCANISNEAFSKLQGSNINRLLFYRCPKIDKNLFSLLKQSNTFPQISVDFDTQGVEFSGISNSQEYIHPICFQNFFYCKTYSDHGNGLSFYNLVTDEKIGEFTKECPDDMTFIQFKNCPFITNETIRFIVKRFPSLKEVVIEGCDQLTDEIFLHLKDLKSLGFLDIKNCNIHGNNIELLSQTLTSLSFSQCPVNDAIFDKCSTFEKLNCFGVRKTHVTADCIAKLAKFKNLTMFRLADIPLSTENIAQLVKSCPYLKGLDLSHTNIDERALGLLSKYELNILSLNDNKLTDSAIKFINTKNLKKLFISKTNIGDKFIFELLEKAPCLDYLRINQTNVTLDCFEKIFNSQKILQFESIEANACQQLPFDFFEKLGPLVNPEIGQLVSAKMVLSPEGFRSPSLRIEAFGSAQ